MAYVIRKLVGLIITLLIVTILVFLVFEIIPGDPARRLLGTEATAEQVEALRTEMGLNRPLPIRYGAWVADFMRGDMGMSFGFHVPVQSMIVNRLPITIVLTAFSFLFILVLSLPISLLSVRFFHSIPDKIMLVLNQIVMSVPQFFIGILFTFLFGLVLRWFVPGGYVSFMDSWSGFLAYLILPALAIALPRAAMTVKLLRNALLAELDKEYVKTARSRGNGQWRILIKHVLKNGFIPVITFMGMTLADLITGSIVIEQVFGIPGIGRILITSIANRDYPMVQAIIVLIAMVILVINVLVDILYHKFDKRIVV
ncbi:MAG: ABC transporter permease [Lachnospiraceae bacterium]|nr:ABC transporter permease [Lachnospiraceae bacterium]